MRTQLDDYTPMASYNGVFLMRKKAEKPIERFYAVFNIDGEEVINEIHYGSLMDAEWEFCSRAFEWFQDNAPINMIEDDIEKIPLLSENITAARKHLNIAARLINEIRGEMNEA